MRTSLLQPATEADKKHERELAIRRDRNKIDEILAYIAQLGTIENDSPRQLQPKEQQRNSGKTTIDGIVLSKRDLTIDIEELNGKKGCTGDNTRQNCTRESHLCVWYNHIDERK